VTEVFFGAKLVGAIEAEIKTEYIGGAIRWADEKFNNAWSNAISEFETAIVRAGERHDFANLKIAADRYRDTVVALLRKYKNFCQVSEADAFLDSVGEGA
jgi:hypothetical protein